MSDYVLIFYSQFNEPDDMPPGEWDPYIAKWKDWLDSLEADGIIRAAAPMKADDVRILTPDGQIHSDGPFVESREVIGGTLQIEAASLDAAAQIARGCPVTSVGGKIEVRRLNTQRRDDLLDQPTPNAN